MLEKMIKCTCKQEWYIEQLHPEYKDRPILCPWCHGKGEYLTSVTLLNYEGDFDPLNYVDVKEVTDDLCLFFTCEHCNDRVFLNEGGDTRACNCGRIYRLNCSIEVDTTYIGDTDTIISLSEEAKING